MITYRKIIGNSKKFTDWIVNCVYIGKKALDYFKNMLVFSENYYNSY